MRLCQLAPAEALNDERAVGQVVNEFELDVNAKPIENQIVGFSYHKLRGHQGFALRFEYRDYGRVARLISVSLGIQSARIDEKRHLPSHHPPVQISRLPGRVPLPFPPTLGHAPKGSWLLFDLRDHAAHALADEFRPVSYTHLTLPTICSV